MLDVMYASNTAWGPEAIPVADGRFGGRDQMRLQEAAVPGMALSFENSADGAKYLNVFKFGHASARPEFFGVLWTKGASPTMSTPATANNADGKFVVFAGYCPLLLAPGETVRAGQYLEPIPNGANQAMWRPVGAGGKGPAFATQSYDNSQGSQGKWVGAVIFPRDKSVGLVGAITSSSAALSLNAETIFDKSVQLSPANQLRVGDVYRVRGKARVTAGGAGNTVVIRSRLNTAAGVLLGESTSFDPGNDALIVLDFLVTIRSIGAGGTLTSAGLALAATNANATGSAGTVAIDTTAANTIVFTADWNADTADAVVLEDLVVEKLN